VRIGELIRQLQAVANKHPTADVWFHDDRDMVLVNHVLVDDDGDVALARDEEHISL
jgi:hypothetical protein